MTDLKSPLQALLQDSGYQTWLVPLDGHEIIVFEDDAVMGFVCIFEHVDILLKQWRELETKLLVKHGPALKKAGEKTWNVYSVFLCPENAPSTELREVRWIEEDLDRTRKLTGCALATREDLTTALLPLLPLQYQPRLDREDFDLVQRLQKRIASIAPMASNAVLDRTIVPSEVIRLLGVEI
jgi:hypothetical protein